MANIILSVLIKDNAKIIERCLNSAKDLISGLVILDTGSTDNTVTLCKDWIKNNKISAMMGEIQFENLGHSRTKLFQLAQNFAKSKEMDLSKTYALMLDPDMTLESKDDRELTAPGYLVKVKTVNLYYYKLALARLDCNWKTELVLGEKWSCGQEAEVLSDWKIYNHTDSEEDRFTRNLELLLPVKDSNSLYLYYLGKNYKDTGHHAKAIEYYKKCIEKGGDNPEVWQSLFDISKCYNDLDRWPEALAHYLKAYEKNPKRSEPLLEIAHHYRVAGSCNLAMTFAKLGIKIPRPDYKDWPVDWEIYKYKFAQEMNIAGFYSGERERGFLACEAINLARGVYYSAKEMARRNEFYYIERLESQNFPLEIERPMIPGYEPERFRAFNPSVLVEGDTIYCNVRTTNYDQVVETGHYHILDPNNVIRTRNFLTSWSKDHQLLSSYEVINPFKYNQYRFDLMGMEDCRLFKHGGDFWVTCTTVDNNPGRYPWISLAKLGKPENGKIELEYFAPIPGPTPGRCEKNWSPFSQNGEIKVIYGYNPLTIYKIDLEQKSLVLEKTVDHGLDLSTFRGGGGPIPWEGGYLTCIHEVIFHPQRHYVHRILYFDQDWNLKKLSVPFYFHNKNIEFCAGLSVDSQYLYFSMGILDKEARIYYIPIQKAKEILRDVPTLKEVREL